MTEPTNPQGGGPPPGYYLGLDGQLHPERPEYASPASATPGGMAGGAGPAGAPGWQGGQGQPFGGGPMQNPGVGGQQFGGIGGQPGANQFAAGPGGGAGFAPFYQEPEPTGMTRTGKIVVLSMVALLALSLGGIFLVSKLSGTDIDAFCDRATDPKYDLFANNNLTTDDWVKHFDELKKTAPNSAKDSLQALRDFTDTHIRTLNDAFAVEQGQRQASDFPDLAERTRKLEEAGGAMQGLVLSAEFSNAVDSACGSQGR